MLRRQVRRAEEREAAYRKIAGALEKIDADLIEWGRTVEHTAEHGGTPPYDSWRSIENPPFEFE